MQAKLQLGEYNVMVAVSPSWSLELHFNFIVMLKKSYSKYIFIYLFIISLSNCSLPEKKDKIISKLFSEQNSVFTNNLPYSHRKNEWNSISSGKNEILFFSIKNKTFIKKINISTIVNNFNDKIDSITIITNNGIVGVFDINNEILIEDSINILMIKINDTKNSKFINAYKNGINFKLDNNNKLKVAIEKIFFFKNDTEKYIFCTSKPFFSKKIENSYFFIDKKFIDYTNTPKSIILNSDFTFTFFNEINDKENIVFGNWKFVNNEKTKIKLIGEMYSATYKDLVKSEFNDIISISESNIFGNKIGIIYIDFPGDSFINLLDLDSTFVLDIRYATTNNFTNTILYNCEKSLLRYNVAKDLVKANSIFKEQGFRIKIFDAYRPRSVQYKMWEACPNINFIAPPDKGSIHNRGGAVDLTLVDSIGNQLDMGTPYDFLGYRAYTTNFDLPDTILNNRLLMQTVLYQYGFNKIRTEWWHFSHRTCMKYELEDFPLPCEK